MAEATQRSCTSQAVASEWWGLWRTGALAKGLAAPQLIFGMLKYKSSVAKCSNFLKKRIQKSLVLFNVTQFFYSVDQT